MKQSENSLNQGQNKRDAILSAARTCFADRGFASTRISDIAKHAGIGKGTVYEYIDSKEDLLLDACLWGCQNNEDEIRIAATLATGEHGELTIDTSLHPVQATYQTLRAVLTVLLAKSQQEHRLFTELHAICRQRPDIHEKTREQFGAKWQQWVETAFALGKHGMAEGFFHDIADDEYRWCARLIVAAVDGFIWQSTLLPQEDPEQVADHVARMWVHLHLKEPHKLASYLSMQPTNIPSV